MTNTDERLSALKRAIKARENDETRYAVAEKVRELGYIDWADFCGSVPPEDQLTQLEAILHL